MISPGDIFIFSKWQKMTENDKKVCLLCSMSQEPYNMIVIYDTYAENYYLPAFFSFFKKFDFPGH